MPRQRVGVVLLLPSPVGEAVDVLRRAMGADDVERLASHLTLVPPVNVRDDDMDAALDLLRDAAARTSPFLLKLGPARTFLPTNPVLFLEVGGDASPVDKLRDKVFRPPLERNLTWPFHPHVTVLDGGPEAKIRAAVEALADLRLETVIDRVHLLQESNDEGVRSWAPIAEAVFGGPSIVGRGGLELELDVTQEVPLDARQWAERAWAQYDSVHNGEPWPKVPLTVTARREGRIVGVVDGDTRPNGEAYLAHLIVSPEARGEGVGAHLVAAFSSAAVDRGATFVSLRTERDGPAVPFYDRLGFQHWYDLPQWRNDKDYVQMRRPL